MDEAVRTFASTVCFANLGPHPEPSLVENYVKEERKLEGEAGSSVFANRTLGWKCGFPGSPELDELIPQSTLSFSGYQHYLVTSCRSFITSELALRAT